MRTPLVVLFLALGALSSAQSLKEFEAHVEQDKVAYATAMKTKNIGYFKKVAVPEFVSIEGPMKMDLKASLKAIEQSFQMVDRFDKLTETKGKVSQKGKDFIWKGELTYSMVLKANSPKPPVMDLTIDATETWQKRNGAWKLIKIEMKTLKQTLNGKPMAAPPTG